MRLMIRCNYCNKQFLGCYETIKIYGAIVELQCPHCNKQTVSNISKFCEEQVGHVDGLFPKTRDIIELSHVIGKLLNNDHSN